MYFKLRCILLLLVVGSINNLQAQQRDGVPQTPVFALKTNLLYDATTTMNLGAEIRLGQQLTLDLPVNYNPWTFANNTKWKHLLVQPELRYWLCESFRGSFFGVHGHYGYYNVGGVDISTYMRNHRFEGWLVGGGVSYGYQWLLSNRWAMEATVGVGYAYLEYDKYPCTVCSEQLSSESKHYFGPTKAGITLIYIIK